MFSHCLNAKLCKKTSTCSHVKWEWPMFLSNQILCCHFIVLRMRYLSTLGAYMANICQVIQNRRKTKENSYAIAYQGSLYSGDLYWGDKLAFSVVPPSLCLSVELSGVWRENGAGHSHQIFRVDRPNRRTRDFVLFRGARRTWHVARAVA